MKRDWLKNWAADLPASVVVFLVALPLCLGIAHGSGAPLMAGVVAGILGGLVVGGISGSALSVSGPAAGLIVIVVTARESVPSYEAFALAVVIAGAVQLALGSFRLGVLGEFVPNTVIKGMLAAIGILLILKQAPHLVGYDVDFEGDEGFLQENHENTFSSLLSAFQHVTPGALIVGLASLVCLILWELPVVKRRAAFAKVPGALVAAVVGVGIHEAMRAFAPGLALTREHLVDLPVVESAIPMVAFPDFGAVANFNVWKAGITIGIVASLESLLSIAAVDKLDPVRRSTPTNRELVAQGAGNVASGLLGGLPITSVIVRSAANVATGARSKLSTILHGLWLLLAVMFATEWLGRIPLALLAAILVYTGYKLAKVELFREMYARGRDQFAPFVITVLGVIFTDLLTGIFIGLAAGLFFLVKSNFHSAILVVRDGDLHLVRLRKDVSFLNKPHLRRQIEAIPDGATVLVDLSRADFIDADIVELIREFEVSGAERGVKVRIRRREATSVPSPARMLKEANESDPDDAGQDPNHFAGKAS